MKENKIHLPLWKRYLDTFRLAGLTNAQLGALIMAMMEYRFEGKEPQKLSKPLQILWVMLRQDCDAARARYEASVENGRKGGRKKTSPEPEKTRQEPDKNQNETQQNPKEGNTYTDTNTDSNSNPYPHSYSQTNTNTPAAPQRVQREDLSISKKRYGEFGWIQLGDDQYRELERLMGADALGQCIAYIDQSAQATGNRNNWQDWFLVLRRCYEGRWYIRQNRKKPEIPRGATGELGSAELEAIRQMMNEPAGGYAY